MRIDHYNSPSSKPTLGSEIKSDPRNTELFALAARPFIKEAVEAAIIALHKPPNLLATGDRDREEVLREERLEYLAELAYEETLHQSLSSRREAIERANQPATIHQLEIPQANPEALAG